jgi:phospholipid transport system substrate-binding protein
MAAVLMGLSLLLAGQAVAAQAPQALVEETSKLMLAKLKEEAAVIKAEPGRIYELVNQIVLPHFDFEYMSQMVLAKHWQRATPDQKKAFTQEFRTLLVRTYATSLNQYTDQKLSFAPFRPDARPDLATVHSEVAQPGGMPIPIDYRLHVAGDSWKVFDVVIDGVSLVTNYRSSFAKEVREGSLESLIKTLADRNKQASK